MARSCRKHARRHLRGLVRSARIEHTRRSKPTARPRPSASRPRRSIALGHCGRASQFGSPLRCAPRHGGAQFITPHHSFLWRGRTPRAMRGTGSALGNPHTVVSSARPGRSRRPSGHAASRAALPAGAPLRGRAWFRRFARSAANGLGRSGCASPRSAAARPARLRCGAQVPFGPLSPVPARRALAPGQP